MRPLVVLGTLLLTVSVAEAQKVVIDPGHGGSDPGATGNGLLEAAVNLDVALRFRDLLVADSADSAGGGSWQVNLTRDSDTTVSLSARSAYANSIGADRFMSIHSNAFSSATANGTETFSYAEGTNSAALRNLVQDEMIEAWQLTNRGNKTANFSVLRETNMPAVLHELAFITNSGDAQKLGSAEQRERAAQAHLYALQRHYGLTPYLPGTAAPPLSEGSVEVVVSAPGGAIVGAEVALDGGAAALTDSDGRLLVEGVPAGEHVVAVWREGYQPADAIVGVVAGETAPLDFSLVPIVDSEGEDDDAGQPGELDGSAADSSDNNDLIGGCTTSGSGSGSPALVGLLVLGFLVSTARRRTRRQGGRGRQPVSAAGGVAQPCRPLPAGNKMCTNPERLPPPPRGQRR